MVNKPFSFSPPGKGQQFINLLFASFGVAALSSFPVVASEATTPSSPTPRNNHVAAVAYNVTSASLAVCPPPLIPNIYNLTTLGCDGACCIPCPVSTAFYEPHKLENVYTIASICRIASTLSCLFLSICYLILPSRRKHPHLIVLFFVLLMIPWEALGTAWLFKKDELLCASAYDIAEMNNSWFCGLSGALLPYMALVILSLGTLLIANLHLLTVYRTSLIQNSLGRLMVLTFILPLGAIIPVVIKSQIKYPGFGSICFIGPDMAGPYFFLPLSIVVCVGTLLHLGTISFMVKTAIVANSSSSAGNSHSQSSNGDSNNSMTPRQRRLQTARDVTLQIKQQWRPGFLAFWLLIMDSIYCLFYFFEAKKLLSVKSSTPWFQEWITCLAAQAVESAKAGRISMISPTPDQFLAAGVYAQSTCASIAAPFVPSFTWAAWADLLPAIYGVTVLIIFGSKLELWQDLRELLFGKRYPDGGKIIMGDFPKDDGRNNVYYNSHRNKNGNGPSSAGDAKLDGSNIENPYGSQTNLAPAIRVSLQKNGSASSSTAALEPWNPSAWITLSTDDNSIQTIPYSASPQPKTSTSSIDGVMKFYNSKELDAVPANRNSNTNGRVSAGPSKTHREREELNTEPILQTCVLSPPYSRPNRNNGRP